MTTDRTTRKLTGLPSWPLVALAGVEKSGKTYAAVSASSSDLIGRTFLFSLGENDPDEYGKVPGQRVELVEHDGTYRDLLDGLLWAKAQPWPDELHPNLIILDSGTRLWELLTDMAQAQTLAAARRKAARQKRDAPDPDEVKITPDQWNLAASRWQNVIDVLREHQGPSIVTSRLDLVMVMDQNGSPTRDKTWKVQAHKSFVYDVDAVIELRQQALPGSPSPALLRAVRSLAFKPGSDGETAEFPGGLPLADLWKGMGLAEGFGTRRHTAPAVGDPDESEAVSATQSGHRDTRPPSPAPEAGTAEQVDPRGATPGAAAEYLLSRLEAEQDAKGLAGAYFGAERWIASLPWVSQFESYDDFVKRQTVEFRGQIVPLYDAVATLRGEREHGGAAAETGGGDGSADADPDPASGPVDDHDPWAEAGPTTLAEARGESRETSDAVSLIKERLGGEVISDEPMTGVQRVAAQHQDDLAARRAAREEDAAAAASDQRGAAGPARGVGYQQYKAERERLAKEKAAMAASGEDA